MKEKTALLLISIVGICLFSSAGADTIHVKSDGTGDYPTIQAAITVAGAGDIIQVEDGTYTGDGNRDIDFLGKAITVRGSTGNPTDVVVDCEASGSRRRRGFNFINGEDENSVLENITIKHGYGLVENEIEYYYLGGGILCKNSSPTIRNCVITNNYAGNVGYGGGIFNYYSNPVIENCVIKSNSSTDGGGVCNHYSRPNIRNCEISYNNVTRFGGGICNKFSGPMINNCMIKSNSTDHNGGGMYNNVNGGLPGEVEVINNCTFVTNSAGYYGGAIHVAYGSPVIKNCIISSNTAQREGAGISVFAATPIIQDCVIRHNTATERGGGIFNSSGSAHSTIQNCTIIHNHAGESQGKDVYNDLGSTDITNSIVWGNSQNSLYRNISVSYSNVEGGYSGVGNIDVDPLFETDGYHLTYASCCIDAGDPNIIIDPNAVDIDNDPRVVFSVDMGADEFISDNACMILDNNLFDFGQVGIDDEMSIELLRMNNYAYNTLNWHIESECDWIQVFPMSGQTTSLETRTIEIRIDHNNIDYGLQTCPFQIVDPNAINSPMPITISLEVLRPEIDLSQNLFDFTIAGISSDPEANVLTIQNNGLGLLNWTIIGADACEWLSVLPENGQVGSGVSTNVNLSVNPAIAGYGLHSCELTISDPNAANSPQTVTVNLAVLGPEIGLNQNNLSFISEDITGSLEPQVLTIGNTGYDTLHWTIAGADVCEWLTVMSEGGQTGSGASSDVSLSVAPVIAGYGSHSCELTVSDPNASNSPQVVTVTLDVLRPEITVSPASFGFDCDVDDPNVLMDTFTISNSGYDTLNWQISEDCDWFSVEPESGQCVSGPNDMTLTVDTAGLEVGCYDCQLTITDENASNSPVTVPVWLHVYRDGERHVPTEYPTIQAAIDAAVEGDHVIVHPGRHTSVNYYEEIRYHGKAITVRSIEPDNPEIVASTIVTGQFYFIEQEGRNSVLDGLTLNGNIYCGQNSSPMIKNCTISSRRFDSWDHCLISIYGANPYIQNCTFAGMQFNKEGYAGIVIGGNRDTSGDTIIENCLFSLKYGYTYPYEQRPAIQIRQGHADVINTTIAYCVSNIDDSYPYESTGTAVSIRESDVSIRNSVIWGNDGSDNVQVTVLNHSEAIDDPLNSDLNINYTIIEGGRDNILIFPNYSSFDAYWRDGILPDPNLVDPNTVIWGPGNMDIDPLFVREPNDGGDGWFPISIPGTSTLDYSPTYNNDYGDLHLKSEAGRFVWDGFARADFNLDKRVDLVDFSEMSQNWRLNLTTSIQLPCNLYWGEMVDLKDLMLFCDDYLQPRVFGVWVADDVTSPCIDAGDPNDMDWQNELWPHGGRINMGAYGGTSAASMSLNPIGNPADLNHNDAVDLADWSLWSDDWLDERILLDSDFDRDNDVDPNDLSIFLNNWLWGK